MNDTNRITLECVINDHPFQLSIMPGDAAL
ncbi:Uncharacterised protein [Citrobacter amalonaticus]|nr:Uncharacterised protein [Citrobacter amalonaticus]